jgi:hypothetical protein
VKSRMRRGRWSAAEDRKLLDLFGTRDDVSLARRLRRPVPSVRRRVQALLEKRRPVRRGPWLDGEVERLRRSLGVVTLPLLARIVERRESDVRSKIDELARSIRTDPWEGGELRFLKSYFGSREDGVLAIVLGRTVEAVQRMARQLGLAKDRAFLRRLQRSGVSAQQRAPLPSRTPRWTAREVSRLRELYAHHSNLEIAVLLGRSVKSVVAKAHGLGLRKSSERLERMGRSNVALRYRRDAARASAQAAAQVAAQVAAQEVPRHDVVGAPLVAQIEPTASPRASARQRNLAEPR